MFDSIGWTTWKLIGKEIECGMLGLSVLRLRKHIAALRRGERCTQPLIEDGGDVNPEKYHAHVVMGNANARREGE